MRLQIDPKIDFGHVLTMVSVLVSLIALLMSWAKDRELQMREQADEVRSAAAQTLAPLERWGELSSFLYREIDPAFVKAGVMRQEGATLEKIRDEVLRLANESRSELLWLRLRSDLAGQFTHLYAFHPEVRQAIEALIAHLSKQEDKIFGEFLREIEQRIMEPAEGDDDSPKTLSRALGEIGHRYHHCSLQHSKGDLEPIAAELTKMVEKSDKEILDRRSNRQQLEQTFSKLAAWQHENEVGEDLCAPES